MLTHATHTNASKSSPYTQLIKILCVISETREDNYGDNKNSIVVLFDVQGCGAVVGVEHLLKRATVQGR
jgi:hypothetical protein